MQFHSMLFRKYIISSYYVCFEVHSYDYKNIVILKNALWSF